MSVIAWFRQQPQRRPLNLSNSQALAVGWYLIAHMFILMAASQYVGHSRPFTPSQWLILNVLGGCVALAGVSYYKMQDQGNAEQEKTGQKFSRWSDPFTAYQLFKTHRRLYPESRLPALCLAGILGMVVMAPVMVFFGPR
jgi:hypothetical protein